MILLRFIGFLWALPHTLFGVLLLLTIYFPRSVVWCDGALDVVVRWKLRPASFNPGAQTHGVIIFYADAHQLGIEPLRRHERRHVDQCMVLGGVLYPLFYGLHYLWNYLTNGFDGGKAYEDNWFEKDARRAE